MKKTNETKVGSTVGTVESGTNGESYIHRERMNRWREAMPEAVRRVCECRAMRDGRLLPMAQLECIDGRKIDEIVLDILHTKYILNKNGDYQYTHSEESSVPYMMRRQSLDDAQAVLLLLLDYRDYVPESDAVRFYAKFYCRGDQSARDIAGHAICAAMNIDK